MFPRRIVPRFVVVSLTVAVSSCFWARHHEEGFAISLVDSGEIVISDENVSAYIMDRYGGRATSRIFLFGGAAAVKGKVFTRSFSAGGSVKNSGMMGVPETMLVTYRTGTSSPDELLEPVFDVRR